MLIIVVILMATLSDGGLLSKDSLPWPLNRNVDPDVDICNDPTVTGVVADDGQTYIFKKGFYWTTKPLDKSSGFTSFANATTSKWPEVDGEIKAVFTVKKSDKLMTIFVVKNQWFGYQSSRKIMEGTTDNWPDFSTHTIEAMFSARSSLADPEMTQIYAIHSNNLEYTLYDFKDMSNPIKVKTGPTVVSQYFLWFLEKSPGDEGKRLKNLMDIKAGLNYDNKLVLLSKKRYCLVNLVSTLYEKECLPKDINQILKCPLDITKRPTPPAPVDPVKAEDPAEDEDSSAEDATKIRDPKTTKGVKRDIPSDDNSEPVRTSIPILGREWIDEEEENSTLKADAADEMAIQDIHNENSGFWVIVFMVGLIVVAVGAVVMVGAVAGIKNKRPKGEVTYTKGSAVQ